MKKHKIALLLTTVICAAMLLIPVSAAAYNGTPVESGEDSELMTITNLTEDERAAILNNLTAKAGELMSKDPTAAFDPATREIRPIAIAPDDTEREEKVTYITQIPVAAFYNINPINIILPQPQDNLIINLEGVEEGQQYKFMCPLLFDGEAPSEEDDREPAGKVLINFGTVGKTGFLDFFKTDGISVLYPNGEIVLPCVRVELVVLLLDDGTMYTAEVDANGRHSCAIDEYDVLAARDFIPPKEPETVDPEPSKDPAADEEPSNAPAESESSSEQQPADSPAESSDSAQSQRPSKPASEPSASTGSSSGGSSEHKPTGKPASSAPPLVSKDPKPSDSLAPEPSESESPTSSEPVAPVESVNPSAEPSEDPNHVAYVPGKSVDVNSPGQQDEPDTSEPIGSESAGPEITAPAETDPLVGPTEETQEDSSTGALNTIITVLGIGIAAICILIIVVLIIMKVQKKAEKNNDHDLRK